MDTLQQRIADTIRREVRHSAGIPEGQEFRCDWLAIAAAVMCAVNARDTGDSVKSPAEIINERLGGWRVFSSDEQQMDFCLQVIDWLTEAGYEMQEAP